MYRFTDFRARQISCRQVIEFYARSGPAGSAKVVGLRVVPIFKPGPAASIRLTRQQELVEPFRPSKSIRTIEYLENG